MTKEAEEFRWTPLLTNSFFHFRLRHEWLFKKKKQAWKDLHKILLNSGFSSTMTVNHIRKKWSYTIDEYQKAVAQNNTNWIYYDLFHSYLGKSNSMEAFPHWSNEWIVKLIEARIENEHLFTTSSEMESDGWGVIECNLREMNLPIECSVNNIDKIWLSLTKTFRSKQRFYVNSKSPNIWPFYDIMKKYYKTHNPNILKNIRLRSVNKKKDATISVIQDSDDECLKDIKNNLMNLEKKECDANIFHYDSTTSHQDSDDFRWTPQWTESFLHIRLQNEWRFKQKKQSWKELHSIMMENGFPDSMTVDHIRRKWNATYEEYKKAVTLNNTKWIYYNIMHSYLGKVDTLESFENWTNEWIMRLIKIKHKLHNPLDEEKCWLSVEAKLRREGIPLHCSLRKISLIWSSLVKAFRINHKYISQNKSGVLWPFYDEMKQFYEKYEPQLLVEITTPKKGKQIEDDDDGYCDNVTSTVINNEEELDSENVVKKEEISIINCRACLGHSEVMTPLIEFDGDIILYEKMTQCTSVQISEKDCFPQYLCQTCTELLDIAYKFKKKCEKTDDILKTSWYQKMELANVKSEVSCNETSVQKINKTDSCEESDSIHINMDNGSVGYLSENELKDEDVIKSELLDDVSSQLLKSSNKKSIKKAKHQKDSLNRVTKKLKKPRKSKNVVMVPALSESGETVYKRRYVYWKVCDICGKSTQRMKEHMKGHSEIKTHKCTKCPKTFTYSASLQTHLRTHDSTPLKICQVCGKEFFRNLTYKRHLVYHANERKFSCETCGKTFNTSDILRIHIRSHTGERPYSCKICDKSFYSRGCVARHQKVHRKQML